MTNGGIIKLETNETKLKKLMKGKTIIAPRKRPSNFPKPNPDAIRVKYRR